MANMYRSVLAGGGGVQPTGDAVAADVLSGKTFSNADGVGKTGTMPNNGAVSGTATPSQPYTIPAGYHNGSGTVTASSAASSGAFTTIQNTPVNVNLGYKPDYLAFRGVNRIGANDFHIYAIYNKDVIATQFNIMQGSSSNNIFGDIAVTLEDSSASTFEIALTSTGFTITAKSANHVGTFNYFAS